MPGSQTWASGSCGHVSMSHPGFVAASLAAVAAAVVLGWCPISRGASPARTHLHLWFMAVWQSRERSRGALGSAPSQSFISPFTPLLKAAVQQPAQQHGQEGMVLGLKHLPAAWHRDHTTQRVLQSRQQGHRWSFGGGGLGSRLLRSQPGPCPAASPALSCYHGPNSVVTFVWSFGTVRKDEVPASRKRPALESPGPSQMWLPSSLHQQKTARDGWKPSPYLPCHLGVQPRHPPAHLEGASYRPQGSIWSSETPISLPEVWEER